jgi:prepilin-type processing-associated H-X9-DG protein
MYDTGTFHGDTFSLYSCNYVVSAYGTNRGARGADYGKLMRDTPGYYPRNIFGSPHAGGANFVMCDGSVRQISYGIDSNVYDKLGNRSDGEAIDLSSLAF